MDKEKREQEKHKTKIRTVHSREPFSFPFCGRPFLEKGVLVAVFGLIIAFLLTPSFTLENPHYQLGDVADANVKAKRDFLVEDEEATFRKRQESILQAPLVYDLDENVLRETVAKVDEAFKFMREYLADAAQSGRVGVASPDRASESMINVSRASMLPGPAAPREGLHKKADFQKILGIELSEDVFLTLLKKEFSQDFQDRINQLLTAAFEQGIVTNKALLAEARDRSLVIQKIRAREEFILPPPHRYFDLEESRRFIRMQALDQGGEAREMLAVAFLVSGLMQPNLTFNRSETELRREQAEASVKPVYVQLKRNEMLVREGQKVGPEELLKLRAHEEGRTHQHRPLVFITIFLSCTLCIWVFLQVFHEHLPSLRMETQDFLFLGVLLILLLVMGRFAMWVADMVGDNSVHLSGKTLIYAVPLTAGAMMASIFFGVTVSLLFSLLVTIFSGMLFGRDFGIFFYFLIGSFVAAHGAASCRNRMIPLRAGLLVGCANVVIIVLNALLQDQWVFLSLLIDGFFGFCGGVFAGILVTGLTPLAEMCCGYTTDVKLLELATMDQPLLQELMVQAPGTYHHSIIVGNMVEAAAKSIGANSLLAKVAGYYHDIGKIKKPLYFIENQFDCQNRHEKLAPSMSSLILISHVKDGVELARQHRLGKSLIDIINQHHGTSFISFFYKKAMEAREKALSTKGPSLPPINMDDYRYPGPKPQTKEAGLVMLADVVEAACRSLSEPTPARIQGMVNRLINNIFSDGQLEECELTLKDLHQIARHFNQILATVHHKRIEYPALTAGSGAKVKSDASDPGQREPKQDRDRSPADREGGRGDLKRLGIH